MATISIFSIPESVTVTVGLDDKTLAFAKEVLNHLIDRKELKALMTDLGASTASLDKTVKDNPDPNPLT